MKSPFLAAAFVLAAAHGASAATVSYDYTATFISKFDSAAFDDLADLAATFASISGTITFDTAPTGPLDEGTRYPGYAFTVNEFALPDGLLLPFATDVADSTSDFVAGRFTLPPGTSRFVQVLFDDFEADAISASDPFPDLAAAPFGDRIIRFQDFFSGATNEAEAASFTITSLTPSDVPAPIPLPAGAWLLAGALCLLAAARRQR